MPSQGFRICRVRHRAAAQELLHEKKSLLGFREACLFQIGCFFVVENFQMLVGELYSKFLLVHFSVFEGELLSYFVFAGEKHEI